MNQKIKDIDSIEVSSLGTQILAKNDRLPILYPANLACSRGKGTPEMWILRLLWLNSLVVPF